VTSGLQHFARDQKTHSGYRFGKCKATD